MAGIRIIAGTAKGRKLKLVPGDSTRPVADRVKESVFNIIGGGIGGAAFLDLFGGTGSVGIEALSRGAANVVFVDKDKFAVKTMAANLEIANFKAHARVIRGDALDYLKSGGVKSFDYIYIAPPQYHGLWAVCLRLIDAKPQRLNPDGWAIAQIDPREYAEMELVNLVLIDRRKYGSTMLCIYERPGE